MTTHEHREYVEGCFRCDLSRDEASWNMNESDDLTFMIAGWDTSTPEHRLAPPWCRSLADTILAAGWRKTDIEVTDVMVETARTQAAIEVALRAQFAEEGALAIEAERVYDPISRDAMVTAADVIRNLGTK